MKIKPNETKVVVKEYSESNQIPVWNRTDKPITVYYTNKGIEIQ